MIIVRLMGGLGNQMFQYAAAKAVAIRNNTILKIDTTLLEENKKNPHGIVTHRELDLDIFNLRLIHASQREVEYFNGKKYASIPGKLFNKALFLFRKRNLIIESGKTFEARLLKLPDNKCLVGSWQSEKYFKDVADEIHQAFKFRRPVLDASKAILDNINDCDSICVNVRRGDYVTSPIYSKTLGAFGVEYYHAGLDYFTDKLNNPRVFVFSDDLNWCRENLRVKFPVEYIGHEHAGERFGNYLQLMKQCRHFVIPNSSFGWWGAWLSEYSQKKIIAPLRWFIDRSIDSRDLVPEDWLRI